nr:MAG TPA: hypothetical protein [Caudoviricetes sp.]
MQFLVLYREYQFFLRLRLLRSYYIYPFKNYIKRI